MSMLAEGQHPCWTESLPWQAAAQAQLTKGLMHVIQVCTPSRFLVCSQKRSGQDFVHQWWSHAQQGLSRRPQLQQECFAGHTQLWPKAAGPCKYPCCQLITRQFCTQICDKTFSLKPLRMQSENWKFAKLKLQVVCKECKQARLMPEMAMSNRDLVWASPCSFPRKGIMHNCEKQCR